MRLMREIERLRAHSEQLRQTLTATLAALARQRETLAARLRMLAEQQQDVVQQRALAWPTGDRRSPCFDAAPASVDGPTRGKSTVGGTAAAAGAGHDGAGEAAARCALPVACVGPFKREKYDGWLERQRHAHRLTQLYRQETETEEMMTWNRSRG
uniref:Putative SpaM-like protein n=1 Tax=Sodalis glossinidius TaxID=63612 RepID=Q9EZ18_SODGL|nr:putative SpaM-like protein [Sodalis glossinidius]